MSFRDNLQYLRAQRNFTQERLAMLLGVSRCSVARLTIWCSVMFALLDPCLTQRRNRPMAWVRQVFPKQSVRSAMGAWRQT